MKQIIIHRVIYILWHEKLLYSLNGADLACGQALSRTRYKIHGKTMRREMNYRFIDCDRKIALSCNIVNFA